MAAWLSCVETLVRIRADRDIADHVNVQIVVDPPDPCCQCRTWPAERQGCPRACGRPRAAVGPSRSGLGLVCLALACPDQHGVAVDVANELLRSGRPGSSPHERAAASRACKLGECARERGLARPVSGALEPGQARHGGTVGHQLEHGRVVGMFPTALAINMSRMLMRSQHGRRGTRLFSQ